MRHLTPILALLVTSSLVAWPQQILAQNGLTDGPVHGHAVAALNEHGHLVIALDRYRGPQDGSDGITDEVIIYASTDEDLIAEVVDALSHVPQRVNLHYDKSRNISELLVQIPHVLHASLQVQVRSDDPAQAGIPGGIALARFQVRESALSLGEALAVFEDYQVVR